MSKNGREAEERASKRGKVIRTGRRERDRKGKRQSARVEEILQLRGKEIIRGRGQASGKVKMYVKENWWKR